MVEEDQGLNNFDPIVFRRFVQIKILFFSHLVRTGGIWCNWGLLFKPSAWSEVSDQDVNRTNEAFIKWTLAVVLSPHQTGLCCRVGIVRFWTPLKAWIRLPKGLKNWCDAFRSDEVELSRNENWGLPLFWFWVNSHLMACVFDWCKSQDTDFCATNLFQDDQASFSYGRTISTSKKSYHEQRMSRTVHWTASPQLFNFVSRHLVPAIQGLVEIDSQQCPVWIFLVACSEYYSVPWKSIRPRKQRTQRHMTKRDEYTRKQIIHSTDHLSLFKNPFKQPVPTSFPQCGSPFRFPLHRLNIYLQVLPSVAQLQLHRWKEIGSCSFIDANNLTMYRHCILIEKSTTQPPERQWLDSTS